MHHTLRAAHPAQGSGSVPLAERRWLGWILLTCTVKDPIFFHVLVSVCCFSSRFLAMGLFMAVAPRPPLPPASPGASSLCFGEAGSSLPAKEAVNTLPEGVRTSPAQVENFLKEQLAVDILLSWTNWLVLGEQQ